MNNNLILLFDEQYEKYANLLAKRDQLLREADVIETGYFQKFGKLIEKSFKLKIECIRYKKMISFCQAKINSGEKINPSELNSYIESELELYEEQLAELKMLSRRKLKDGNFYDYTKVKRVYREIVKMIHPDLHPDLYKHPEIRKLWKATVISYRANDYSELENLKVQITVTIQKITGKTDLPLPKIDNLDDRIKSLKAEIAEISTSEPYIYNKILSKPKEFEKRKQELNNEIEIYENYLKDLKKTYATFEIKGDKND